MRQREGNVALLSGGALTARTDLGDRQGSGTLALQTGLINVTTGAFYTAYLRYAASACETPAKSPSYRFALYDPSTGVETTVGERNNVCQGQTSGRGIIQSPGSLYWTGGASTRRIWGPRGTTVPSTTSPC